MRELRCHPIALAGFAERLEPKPEVDVRRAALAFENVAFAEQGRYVARQGTEANRLAVQYHVGETRVETELGHRLPVFGNQPIVERAEAVEEVAGLIEGGFRGQVEPRKSRRVVGAPDSQFQREWREIGFLDFRRRVGLEVLLRVLRP
jgi:hypothetical protein